MKYELKLLASVRFLIDISKSKQTQKHNLILCDYHGMSTLNFLFPLKKTTKHITKKPLSFIYLVKLEVVETFLDFVTNIIPLSRIVNDLRGYE